MPHVQRHGVVSREVWVFTSTETERRSECMPVCLRVCALVCTNVCLCVCMCACAYTCLCTGMYPSSTHTHRVWLFYRGLHRPAKESGALGLLGSEPSPEGHRAAGRSGAPAWQGWRSGSPWASVACGFLRSPAYLPAAGSLTDPSCIVFFRFMEFPVLCCLLPKE